MLGEGTPYFSRPIIISIQGTVSLPTPNRVWWQSPLITPKVKFVYIFLFTFFVYIFCLHFYFSWNLCERAKNRGNDYFVPWLYRTVWPESRIPVFGSGHGFANGLQCNSSRDVIGRRPARWSARILWQLCSYQPTKWPKRPKWLSSPWSRPFYGPG